MKICTVGIFFVCCSVAAAFQQLSQQSHRPSTTLHSENDRRSFVSSLVTRAVGAGILFSPTVAHAGIDPTLLKSLPVQGDESGSAQRLRQIEAIQRPSSDLVDVPFTELPSGVSYREYREGKARRSSRMAPKLLPK